MELELRGRFEELSSRLIFVCQEGMRRNARFGLCGQKCLPRHQPVGVVRQQCTVAIARSERAAMSYRWKAITRYSPLPNSSQRQPLLSTTKAAARRLCGPKAATSSNSCKNPESGSSAFKLAASTITCTSVPLFLTIGSCRCSTWAAGGRGQSGPVSHPLPSQCSGIRPRSPGTRRAR